MCILVWVINVRASVYSNVLDDFFSSPLWVTIHLTALKIRIWYLIFSCIIPLQINEAEEKLRQKVESLNQQEREYESLQEEVSELREQLEERGRLLHIASSRVTEVGPQDSNEYV